MSDIQLDPYNKEQPFSRKSDTPIYCGNCGSKLHIATTMNGTPYWASNSGSSRCIWPNPPTQRHFVSARY